MEFEDQVAAQLRDYGYPIFYRNFKLLTDDKMPVSELDIVSSKFIVEVKSGHCLFSGGFNTFYRYKLLPEGFTYFVYAPNASASEMAEKQAQYDDPSYVFTNTLNTIIERVPPPPLCVQIMDIYVFGSLLRIVTEELMKFKRIYVSEELYTKIRDTLQYTVDHYHEDVEAPGRMTRLKLLYDQNILCFDPPGDDVIPIVKGKNYERPWIRIKLHEKISIPHMVYHTHDFQHDPPNPWLRRGQVPSGSAVSSYDG